MQKRVGMVRQCVEDYRMIEEGDKIAVGVSGGKDSLVLLTLLGAWLAALPVLASMSFEAGGRT